MTLQEIYAALAAVENGATMANTIQAEINRLRNEAATYRATKNKILQALGLQDGEDLDNQLAGIQASLSALSKTGNKPDEIGRQLAQLTAQVQQLTEKAKQEEERAKAEREKRINTTKLNQALAVLQAGNAANPQEIAKIILSNIQAKDDDTIVYMADGKEMTVEEGVKAWLAANSWAVKNTQTPGAGSAGGGSGGAPVKYTRAQIEKMTPDEINANWDAVQESLKSL
mgnify:CR=1 FL=1